LPLHIGNIEIAADYVLYYQKGKDTIIASAPNKDDVKELFAWLKDQVFP